MGAEPERRSEPTNRAMQRPSRSTDAVRRDLIEAAARLGAEHGVAAVTFRQLADASGTADSVLLRQFGTKNGLLVDAVIQPAIASLADLIDSWRALPDGGGSYDALLADLYDWLCGSRDVVRLLLATEAIDDGDEVLAEVRRSLKEVLGGLVEVSGERARLSGTPLSEPELTAPAVIAMMVAVTALDDMLFPDLRPDPGLMLGALFDFVAHGRAGSPGGAA